MSVFRIGSTKDQKDQSDQSCCSEYNLACYYATTKPHKRLSYVELTQFHVSLRTLPSYLMLVLQNSRIFKLRLSYSANVCRFKTSQVVRMALIKYRTCDQCPGQES